MAQDGSGPGGILGELFGELARPPEPVPYHPVHPRVLTVGDPEGATMAAAVWEDPGGAAALHRGVRARVEAALLAALSQPPRDRNEATWRWLRLALFADVPDAARALRAFGLERVEPAGGGWRRVMAHLRHERTALDRPVPEEPVSHWQVRFGVPEGERGERLRTWDRELAEHAGDEVWGAHPGAPFRRLAALFERDGLGRLEPTLEALDRLESELVLGETGVLRWIPPQVFQALCDGVAVVAQVALGRRAEWALCEPDAHGLAPPPLVRVHRKDGGHEHVPLGLALLRWCIMPLQPGEHPDPLRAWATHQ
ncbi:MAG: hypothetical protein ACODAU_11880, partial [Myxococcota bacterium]